MEIFYSCKIFDIILNFWSRLIFEYFRNDDLIKEHWKNAYFILIGHYAPHEKVSPDRVLMKVNHSERWYEDKDTVDDGKIIHENNEAHTVSAMVAQIILDDHDDTELHQKHMDMLQFLLRPILLDSYNMGMFTSGGNEYHNGPDDLQKDAPIMARIMERVGMDDRTRDALFNELWSWKEDQTHSLDFMVVLTKDFDLMWNHSFDGRPQTIQVTVHQLDFPISVSMKWFCMIRIR